MRNGYWIAHLDVHDPKGFQAYRDLADEGHRTFGSKLLVRGGRREVVEGRVRTRNVLREFNSFDEAMAYYRGAEYSQAHPLREPHSTCDFLIVEGYDGPQPTAVGTTPEPSPLKGYWIAHVDVTDVARFDAYQAMLGEPFGRYGGRSLIRSGRQEVPEGRLRSRTVVLEFPSYDAALACYRSPQYQTALAARRGAADVDLVIIEGTAAG